MHGESGETRIAAGKDAKAGLASSARFPRSRTPISTGDPFVVAAGFTGEREATEMMTKAYVVVPS